MPLKLTDQQIQQKLTEGRNYKRLYTELKVKYDDAQAEIKQLHTELSEQRVAFEAIIENQNARITELETIAIWKQAKRRYTNQD